MSKLVVIGASTGGPKHIEKILKALPLNYTPAIIIAQHMDDQYIPSFIKRLDSVCKLQVQALSDGGVVKPNNIYICSSICRVYSSSGAVIGSSECAVGDYNPSIDTFFSSVAKLTDTIDVLSVVLTGIGADGAKGMHEIFNSGGKAVVESSQSAVVYGMPLRAKEMTPQAKECSLDKIIDEILEF